MGAYEQAMIRAARPQVLAAKAMAAIQNEVAKGCSPQLFTEPVALESPFRPVMAHRDLFAGATESFFLPEPSPSLEDLIRFQVWTSPDQTFDWIRSELFLKHSVDVQHRVGFEILGNRS